MIWKLTQEDYKTSKWSGGTTAQIAIYPPDALYAERDFLWRVSSARVELEESDFTALPDYERLICTLEGEIELTHNRGAALRLKPFRVHSFSGADATHCRGRCRDFNLMLRRDRVTGSLELLKLGEAPMSVRWSGPLVLYCAAGVCQAAGELLKAGESLLAEGEEAVELTGPAAVLYCKIQVIPNESNESTERRHPMEQQRRLSLEELLERVQINTHSSVRILAGARVLYVDPFRLEEAPHDGDLIFFTHDHFDHLSPEDVEKVSKPGSVFVAPATAKKAAAAVAAGRRLTLVEPGERGSLLDIPFEAVAAYNPAKHFHPKANGWVGYVLTVGGRRIYIAGDTDRTPEAEAVRCDLALLPIGGKYTMDPEQAAGLVNLLKPQAVIPFHYGSVAGSPKDFDRFAALVDPAIRVCRKV